METVSDDDLPTPRQVAEAIRKLGAERCYQMPQRQPLDELWVPDLGVWLDMENLSYSGDRARGHHYPGWIGKWFLRRAVCWWEKNHG